MDLNKNITIIFRRGKAAVKWNMEAMFRINRKPNMFQEQERRWLSSVTQTSGCNEQDILWLILGNIVSVGCRTR